jgi:hypothetical protein
MAQQLGEHAQGLISQILIDEGLLSGQSLGRAAGRLIVVFVTCCGNFWELCCAEFYVV